MGSGVGGFANQCIQRHGGKRRDRDDHRFKAVLPDDTAHIAEASEYRDP